MGSPDSNGRLQSPTSPIGMTSRQGMHVTSGDLMPDSPDSPNLSPIMSPKHAKAPGENIDKTTFG